jgi:hypothetical protein
MSKKFEMDNFKPEQEKPEAVKNFNDQVWVKVTAEGKRIREGYFKQLGIEAPPLEQDSEGWTKMQLHEVANLFGREMYTGNPRLPIETTFRTEAPEK